jgi:hypothetical protein
MVKWSRVTKLALRSSAVLSLGRTVTQHFRDLALGDSLESATLQLLCPTPLCTHGRGLGDSHFSGIWTTAPTGHPQPVEGDSGPVVYGSALESIYFLFTEITHSASGASCEQPSSAAFA